MNEPTPIAKTLKGAFSLIQKDLDALPDEAYHQSFGPKVRTVADLVYEVNLVNDHVGMVIRGEKAFDWPHGDYVRAPKDLQGKEAVIAAFKASSERILQTVEAYTPEEMAAPLDDQEGGTTNREERCRFMALHAWYHSGQFNFIQTLRGDDDWHWK